MENSIYYSETVCKQISNLKLEKYFRRIVLRHIMTILIAVFSFGYRGKTTQMSTVSEKHRTTITYFLNTSTGIRRYWLLMSLVHYICCFGTGTFLPLQDGLKAYHSALLKERITYIYQCGGAREPLDNLLALVA